MQFYNRVKSFFTGQEGEKAAEGGFPSSSEPAASATAGSGFVSKQRVAIPRQPVLQSAGYSKAGGVQGLDWYKAALKVDSDGDIAHEFLLEPSRPSRKGPPDKPLKVQKRNVKDAALTSADMIVEHGQVCISADEKQKRKREP